MYITYSKRIKNAQKGYKKRNKRIIYKFILIEISREIRNTYNFN